MDMEDDTPVIVIKIATQDGLKRCFRMKRESKLMKLLLVFCERQEVSFRSMRFLYRGKRIKVNSTPDLLKMKDGDEIDAMTDQDGGGCSYR